MTMLDRRSALADHPWFKPGTRLGAIAHDRPAVVVAERRPLAIAQISAFGATLAACEQRLPALLDLELPAPGRATGDMARALRSIGPGVWQLVTAPALLHDVASLRDGLRGIATVADLSHARAALQVAGPAAVRALNKFCPLDLDERRFPTGSATNTRFGHLGATLARLHDAPAFELLVFRGYAEFVFEALVEGAAEFGVEVGTAG
jgi:sarcosine oxidase subunit gamma